MVLVLGLPLGDSPPWTQWTLCDTFSRYIHWIAQVAESFRYPSLQPCCALLCCAVRPFPLWWPQGLQRMAAAWQAVPIRQPPTPVRQGAAFALTYSGPPLLYAAGGCHPDLLQVWDLASEHVMQQVGASSARLALKRSRPLACCVSSVFFNNASHRPGVRSCGVMLCCLPVVVVLVQCWLMDWLHVMLGEALP